MESSSGDKEIERLKKQQLRAQGKGDVKEEAALCNAIGDRYFHLGDLAEALRYHQNELALSAAAGNLLDEGVAHRKVGECLCEMGQYEEAVEHQKSHLQLARRLKNLPEEQRALATLGRTFFIQSEEEQSKRHEEEGRVSELLVMAGTHYLQSLEVCDRLVGQLSDRELLEMRSRLYLNLGLVYEMKTDYHSARMFMVKALGVLEEMKDSATIYQCHSSLGSLHMLENHAHLALPSFQRALTVASELRNRQYEMATLGEMAQCHMCLSQFEESKGCLKRCLKMADRVKSEKQERPYLERQLKAVRKVLYFRGEVEKVKDGMEPRELARRYDRLGDLCCALKAYPAAAKFYGKQLGVVESGHGEWSREEVCQVYVSLARTLEDCGQFSQALFFYNKEVSLLKDKPAEASESWSVIARVREAAGLETRKVLEAYAKAISLGTGRLMPRTVYSFYKSVVRYVAGHEDSVGVSKSSFWRRKASKFLEDHSMDIQQEVGVAGDGGEGGLAEDRDDGEDSQVLEECGGDTPEELGLSSMDEDEGLEEEEEEGGGTRGVEEGSVADNGKRAGSGGSGTGRPKRIKVNLERKNWRGESLLQVAVINNDVAAVKRLIKKGALVHTRDNCGWTPLHEACNYGYLEVARLLIENGAHIDDPGGMGCDGVTPLIDAATNGHMDLVKLLVESKADVMTTDKQGRSALTVVEERLESSQESEDEDSHDANQKYLEIRSYLAAAVKRCGHHTHSANKTKSVLGRSRHGVGLKEPSGGKRASGTQSMATERRSVAKPSHQSRQSQEGSCQPVDRMEASLTVLGRKTRWNERILYDDDEDVKTPSRTKKRKVQEENSMIAESETRSIVPEELGKVSGKGQPDGMVEELTQVAPQSPRPMYNCLGQLEAPGPSLIEEKLVEEEVARERSKRSEEEEEEGERIGYRVIDNWLVDNMGKVRRKRHERDRSVEKESRALLGLSGSSNRFSSRGKTNAAKTNDGQGSSSSLPGSSLSCARNKANRSSTRGSSGDRTRERDGRGGGGGREGATRSTRQPVVLSSSSESPVSDTRDSNGEEEEEEEEFHRWRATNGDRNAPGIKSAAIPSSHPQLPSSNLLPADNSRPQFVPAQPLPLPMRIRVRILNSSYRIPCPAQLQRGVATTVDWLATQASERYFSQHGRRPVLSLSTVEGDSLCPADPVAHVLTQDEEAVGVVQQWFTPPLLERYLVACRTSGVDPLSNVSELLEEDSEPQKLDLSSTGLLSRDSAPLLQALQSQPSLVSVNLSGNKLRDDAMPRVQMGLGPLPSLQHLDLSSTGITHQGIHMLATRQVASPYGKVWPALRSLNLSHNKLGMAMTGGAGCGLDSLLSVCSGLEDFRVDGCGLTGEVMEAISGPLGAAAHLHTLSLTKNPLGNPGLISLWKAITNLRITTLLLSRVVTAKTIGGVTFSEVLQDKAAHTYFRSGGGRYLEVFDISYCYHGNNEKTLPHLMECLGACPFLKELRLAGWGLVKGSIDSLCRYVQQSSSLTHLDVSGNVSLGNDGVTQLLSSYQQHVGVAGLEEEEGLVLNLVACGMESPLPEELVKIVLRLKRRDDTGPRVSLDLFGNLIEKEDMALMNI